MKTKLIAIVFMCTACAAFKPTSDRNFEAEDRAQGLKSANPNKYKFEAKINAWVGKNQDELFSAWGIPTKTLAMKSGESLASYYEDKGMTTHGSAFGNRTAYGGAWAAGNSSVTTHWCETTFRISAAGVIVSGQFKGTDCASN